MSTTRESQPQQPAADAIVSHQVDNSDPSISQPDKPPSTTLQDHSSQFLIQEYDALRQELTWFRNEANNRFNTFITLSSVVTGGIIVLIGGNFFLPSVLKYSLVLALLVLTFIGFNTFSFAISRRIAMDRIYRAINRVRRRFVDNDPSLLKYLSFPLHDHPTELITSHSLTGVVKTMQSIISFSMAIASSILAGMLGLDLNWTIFIAIFIFVSLFTLLEVYARNIIRNAYKRALRESIFPKT